MTEDSSAFKHDASNIEKATPEDWKAYLNPKATPEEENWKRNYLNECKSNGDDITKVRWTVKLNEAIQRKGAAASLGKLQQDYKNKCNEILKQSSNSFSTSRTIEGIFITKFSNLRTASSIVTQLSLITSFRLPVSVPIAALYTSQGSHFLCMSLVPTSQSTDRLDDNSDFSLFILEKCNALTLHGIDLSSLKDCLYCGSDSSIYCVPSPSDTICTVHPKIMNYGPATTIQMSESEREVLNCSFSENALEKLKEVKTLEEVDEILYHSGLSYYEIKNIFKNENFWESSTEVKTLIISSSILYAIYHVSSSVLGGSLSEDERLNTINYFFHVCLSPGPEWEVIKSITGVLFSIPDDILSRIESPINSTKSIMAARMCQMLGSTLQKGQITAIDTVVESSILDHSGCVSGIFYEPHVDILRSKITSCRDGNLSTGVMYGSTLAGVIFSNFSSDASNRVSQESEINLAINDVVKYHDSSHSGSLPWKITLLQAACQVDSHDCIPYLEKLLQKHSPSDDGGTFIDSMIFIRAVYYLAMAYTRIKTDEVTMSIVPQLESAYKIIINQTTSSPPVFEKVLCAEMLSVLAQTLTRCSQYTGDFEKALGYAIIVKETVISWKGPDDEEVAVAATEVGMDYYFSFIVHFV